MVANEEILRLNQAGIESTRGTGVAATRKLYSIITPNYTKALREFTDTTGTFDGRRRKAFQREVVTFGGTDLMTYEDAPWHFLQLIKGGVTGVTDAGTPPAFTRTFTPSLSTDDLAAITLEFNHVGNAYKSTQVMMNSGTIRIDPDNEGAWILDSEYLARDIASTTHTAAITDRTTEVIAAPGTQLYIDDTAAGLGTTQVLAKLISASITINNNIHFKGFSENVSNFAANKVGRGLRTADAQIVMEFDSDTEFAKFRAGSDRFVRFKQTGAIIHDAITSSIQLDINGPWSTISWGNREGNIIATFGLSGYYNVTNAFTFKAVVVNSLTTLP
jgi:hypothetical protein